jgi:hypothetical protein
VELIEKFKEWGVLAVKGAVVGKPNLFCMRKLRCLRIIAETAPTLWLAGCLASRS